MHVLAYVNNSFIPCLSAPNGIKYRCLSCLSSLAFCLPMQQSWRIVQHNLSSHFKIVSDRYSKCSTFVPLTTSNFLFVPNFRSAQLLLVGKIYPVGMFTLPIWLSLCYQHCHCSTNSRHGMKLRASKVGKSVCLSVCPFSSPKFCAFFVALKQKTPILTWSWSKCYVAVGILILTKSVSWLSNSIVDNNARCVNF